MPADKEVTRSELSAWNEEELEQVVSIKSKELIQELGSRLSRAWSVVGRERVLTPRARRRRGLMNILRMWGYELTGRLYVLKERMRL